MPSASRESPRRAATTSSSAVWPSTTKVLVPSQKEIRPVRFGAQRDARRIPAAVGLGEGDGCRGRPGGDARQVLLFLLLAAADQQGVGGQTDGREERRAEQSRAHLLHERDQLDVAEPETTVRFRNEDRRPPELRADAPPERGVVAAVGLHGRAHLRR